MNIALTLCYLVPKAEYYGSTYDETEACYNSLTWNDIRPKPTWQEILDNTSIAETLALRHSLVVTPLQLIRALILTDEYDNTMLIINQAEPDVKVSWDRSVEIPRNDPFIGGLLQQLEKTDEEADMTFALAKTL